MQKQPGDYADTPIVLALAWYLNVDFLILKLNQDEPDWITGSMRPQSTSPRPPMVLGLVGMHYQSYAPLENAGYHLDKIQNWHGKDTLQLTND